MRGAKETQKQCCTTLRRIADCIPVLGHLKGTYAYYTRGDKKGGARAMMSASRTTAVMGGGVVGFLFGDLFGAVTGGVTGGAAFDTITTLVNCVVHKEFRPYGYYASDGNIAKSPNAGDIFDTCFIPVGDGLVGYSAGLLVNELFFYFIFDSIVQSNHWHVE